MSNETFKSSGGYTCRTAKEGEPYPKMGARKPGVVTAKGAGNHGVWVCISCPMVCRHNFEKDCHISEKPKTGEHVLAWWSVETNEIEVP